MRVTTAFNKLLAVPGAFVTSVTFTPEGVVAGLRHRRRRPICPCGWKGRAVYDRSTRRWRHLDLGAVKLFFEAEIRRLHRRACDRVRTEDVAWARPAARHTRDFEDVVVGGCTKVCVSEGGVRDGAGRVPVPERTPLWISRTVSSREMCGRRGSGPWSMMS